MKENRDKLTLTIPKGDKNRYKEHAENKGMSLTALIVQLLEEDIKKATEKTPFLNYSENSILSKLVQNNPPKSP
jgi:c-di-GMP-related signal transduction protein